MSLEEWQALRASFKECNRDAEPPVLAPGLWFTCITGVAMYVLCYAL